MSTRHLPIAFLTLASLAVHSTPVQAGWMSDWLYGRTATPYSANYYGYPAQNTDIRYASQTGSRYPTYQPPAYQAQYGASQYGAAQYSATQYSAARVTVMPTAGPQVFQSTQTFQPAQAFQPTQSTVSPPYTANAFPVSAKPVRTVPQAPAMTSRPYAPSTYASGYGSVPMTQPVTTVYNNPSVYTGQPTAGVYQSARPVVTSSSLPVAGYSVNRFPVNGTTVQGGVQSRGVLPLRGSLPLASQYPANYQTQTYSSNYGSSAAPLYAGDAMSGVVPTPPNALPATGVVPQYAPQQQPPGGLARFFNSMLGTGYRTSYYSAPITYYRPVTSVDPITGAAVVVQQPCVSSVQQVQRTPYRTLMPLPNASQPMAPCATDVCGPATMTNSGYASPNCPSPTYGQVYGGTTYGGTTYGGTVYGGTATSNTPIGGVPMTGTSVYGDVGQVGGSVDPSVYGNAPIGSYDSNGPSQPSVGAPLVGAPPAIGSGDNAPVDQPRIEAQRPAAPSAKFSAPQPLGDASSAPDQPGSVLDELDLNSPAGDSAASRPATKPSYYTPPSLSPTARNPVASSSNVTPIPLGEQYRSPFSSSASGANPFGSPAPKIPIDTGLNAPDLLGSGSQSEPSTKRAVIPAQVTPWAPRDRSSDTKVMREAGLKRLPAPAALPTPVSQPVTPPAAAERPAPRDSDWAPIRQPRR